MNIRKERTIIRWIHIAGGTLVAIYIYSPWSAIGVFDILTRAVVVPFLILSGVWLWKGALLKKIFGKRG